jgi:hypothetical protein
LVKNVIIIFKFCFNILLLTFNGSQHSKSKN